VRMFVSFIALASIALGQQTERTLSFRNLQSAADFAETATVIRSIGEIRDLRVNAADRSITLYGDPGQAALADWLFTKLDRASDDLTIPDSGQLDYRPMLDADDLVRVLYFRYSKAPENIHQMATVVRSLTEIRRAFVAIAAGAFVVRGTQDQMDAAKWLVDSLDKAGLGTGSHEYRMGGTGENTIGLLPAPTVASNEELKNIASELVLATQSRHVFTYYPLRIIAVRSTPGKIQEAAKIVGQPR
jgi:hypothetical protein